MTAQHMKGKQINKNKMNNDTEHKILHILAQNRKYKLIPTDQGHYQTQTNAFTDLLVIESEVIHLQK